MKKVVSRIWYYKVFYIMMLPGLLWFTIFRYAPMYGIMIAFKDFNIKSGILNSPWATPLLKHFEYFFQSRYFTQLLSNTLIISTAKLITGMGASILLALILNECASTKFKKTIQTLTYMPHFLSWVIVYGIALVFLSESDGFINQILTSLGIKSVPFLSSPTYFRYVLVLSDIWKDCGWGAIIYIASMSSIDPNLYEAATIDGAKRLQLIRYITLPSITSVIIVMLILRLGSVLDAGFDQIYIFYSVPVYEVSDIIDTWVYRTGLEQLNFSLASAVGLFKSFIGMLLIICSNAIARKWGEGIW